MRRAAAIAALLGLALVGAGCMDGARNPGGHPLRWDHTSDEWFHVTLGGLLSTIEDGSREQRLVALGEANRMFSVNNFYYSGHARVSETDQEAVARVAGPLAVDLLDSTSADERRLGLGFLTFLTEDHPRLRDGMRPHVERIARLLDRWTGRERESLVSALGSLGSAGEAALPALERILENEPIGYLAAEAIGEIGDPAKPYLRASLGHEDPARRIGALDAYRSLRSPGAEDVLLVARRLRDADEKVRLAACLTLHSASSRRPIASGTEEVVAFLAPLLDAPEPSVRAAACAAMEILGAPARRHAERLAILLLSDPDRDVRKEAARAVGVLAESAVAVRVLTSALSDSEERVQLEASDRLGRLGAAARSAVPRMLELAESFERRGDRSRARALREVAARICDLAEKAK